MGKLEEIERRLSRIEEKLEEIQQKPAEQPSRRVERAKPESGRVEVPAPVHQARSESKLPSFLQGNPWVWILSQRR